MTIENSDELAVLSHRIYESYGTENIAGIDYFKLYEADLSRFNNVEVLLYQMKEFDLKYVLDIMLSLSYLWKDLSLKDWRQLMIAADREETISSFEEYGFYADIYFLCKYLKIDALDFYLNLDEVSIENKIRVITYFRKHACFLMLSDIDEEDLDGDYFVDISILRTSAASLVQDGEINELKYSDQELSA